MFRVICAMFLVSFIIPGGAAAQSKEGLIKKLEAEQRASLRKEIAHVRAPLLAFRKEPDSPTRCESQNLSTAKIRAMAVLATAGKSDSLDWSVPLVSASLDVADGAKDAGCAKTAKGLYDIVIRAYVGSAFAALRQRAEIGLSDLRSAAR